MASKTKNKEKLKTKTE